MTMFNKHDYGIAYTEIYYANERIPGAHISFSENPLRGLKNNGKGLTAKKAKKIESPNLRVEGNDDSKAATINQNAMTGTNKKRPVKLKVFDIRANTHRLSLTKNLSSASNSAVNDRNLSKSQSESILRRFF